MVIRALAAHLVLPFRPRSEVFAPRGCIGFIHFSAFLEQPVFAPKFSGAVRTKKNRSAVNKR
jgi:hypothetical protein